LSNHDTVRKERTETSFAPVLSYNTMYWFLPERFPHKPIVVDGYPKNVTALVNATVKFSCPTISDLEPYIQWVKSSHRVDDETGPVDVTTSRPYQVRVGMVQVRSFGATCTPVCWTSIMNLLKAKYFFPPPHPWTNIVCLLTSSKQIINISIQKKGIGNWNFINFIQLAIHKWDLFKLIVLVYISVMVWKWFQNVLADMHSHLQGVQINVMFC